MYLGMEYSPTPYLFSPLTRIRNILPTSLFMTIKAIVMSPFTITLVGTSWKSGSIAQVTMYLRIFPSISVGGSQLTAMFLLSARRLTFCGEPGGEKAGKQTENKYAALFAH